MSNNLNLLQLATGQEQKEQTINDANAQIDAAITEFLVVDLSAGNVTLTLAQVRGAVLFKATGNTVLRQITMPTIKRLMYVQNAGTATLNLVRGATTIAVPSGQSTTIYLDSTADGMVSVGGGGGGGGATTFVSLTDAPASYTAQAGKAVNVKSTEDGLEFVAAPYDLALFVPGLPVAGATIFKHKAGRAFGLPANLVGSQGTAVATTAAKAFDVRKNNVTCATISFAVGASLPTFTTSGGTAVSFAAGDVLTIIAPTPQDTTLADVAMTILGTRA